MVIAIGALGLQAERLRLVDLTASMARGLARAEPLADLNQTFASQLSGIESRIWQQDQLVCLELSKPVGLLGLPQRTLRLAEISCQRQIGL